jgi:hypothetical protein
VSVLSIGSTSLPVVLVFFFVLVVASLSISFQISFPHLSISIYLDNNRSCLKKEKKTRMLFLSRQLYTRALLWRRQPSLLSSSSSFHSSPQARADLNEMKRKAEEAAKQAGMSQTNPQQKSSNGMLLGGLAAIALIAGYFYWTRKNAEKNLPPPKAASGPMPSASSSATPPGPVK